MVWNTPKTFVDGEILTANDLNMYVRDNLNETEAAKARNYRGLLVAKGPNQLVERVGASHSVDTSEECTSTSYSDLTTKGPFVTVTTGTRMLVFMVATVSMDTANKVWNMGLEISGADSISPTDARSMQMDGILEDQSNRLGITFLYDELTPGEHTITCKYKVQSNKATFEDRTLTVIPF